jgi:hypothetical protein
MSRRYTAAEKEKGRAHEPSRGDQRTKDAQMRISETADTNSPQAAQPANTPGSRRADDRTTAHPTPRRYTAAEKGKGRAQEQPRREQRTDDAQMRILEAADANSPQAAQPANMPGSRRADDSANPYSYSDGTSQPSPGPVRCIKLGFSCSPDSSVSDLSRGCHFTPEVEQAVFCQSSATA